MSPKLGLVKGRYVGPAFITPDQQCVQPACMCTGPSVALTLECILNPVKPRASMLISAAGCYGWPATAPRNGHPGVQHKVVPMPVYASQTVAPALQAAKIELLLVERRTRELSVRRKLNAMPAVFEGKSVLLVDDSIVRGTTMSQIVEMVRQAGASKVGPAPYAWCMLQRKCYWGATPFCGAPPSARW